MALTDEGNSGIPATMLVGPATMGTNTCSPYPVYMSGQQGGTGNGNGWDNGWWIILLFILLCGGRWGDYGNNGGNGGGYGQPIIVNDGANGSAIQRGFDQAEVNGGINQIQSGVQGLSTQLCGCCSDMQNTMNQGFANVQQSLCNGFAGVNQTVNSGFANAETAANARQMANMQQAFANQTAMAQGFNNIQSQFADCCCENRLASADLKYTIATENCADRYEAAQNTRDIIQSQTNGTQAILDKLCSLELDAKNDKIADLERQLAMANLSASQVAQTARLETSNSATVDALYTRLSQCPVPCMPVYGMTPIFTCNNGNNGGCGCNGGNF